MDSFNLIKYVYNQENDNDNMEGKWFLFGDALKDNVCEVLCYYVIYNFNE